MIRAVSVRASRHLQRLLSGAVIIPNMRTRCEPRGASLLIKSEQSNRLTRDSSSPPEVLVVEILKEVVMQHVRNDMKFGM